MALRFNVQDQMRRFGVNSILDITEEQAKAMAVDTYRQAGLLSDSWKYVQGKSTADYAREKSGTLFQYSGYYDQNKYNALVGGLGGTSSDTLLNRLNAFSSGNSRFYNMMSDYNTFKSWYKSVGGIEGVDDYGMSIDMGLMGSGPLAEPKIQNAWLGLSGIGQALNQEQTNLSNELTAQYGREQNFLSGVTGLTQTATQAKMAAEQKAAQDKLNQQYAQNQAQLQQQAAANAAALAAQQAKQDASYKQAQEAATKAAQEQQLQMNETAQTTALANAATSNKQQAQLQVQNLETQASTLRGNPIVTTNASTTSKQRGSTSRTDRWLSRRAPADSGGGAKI